VRSIADRVVAEAKAAGVRPLGQEGTREGEWALVDLQDVVVHVMLPRVREFYGLERLWETDTTTAAPRPSARMRAPLYSWAIRCATSRERRSRICVVMVGVASAAVMPMISTTTTSSMRVKPRLARRRPKEDVEGCRNTRRLNVQQGACPARRFLGT
jgi:hypothetical protein